MKLKNKPHKKKKITVFHIIEGLSGYGGTPRKLLYITKDSDPETIRHIFFCYVDADLKNEIEEHGGVVVFKKSLCPTTTFYHLMLAIKKYEVNVISTHFTRPMIFGFIAAMLFRLPMVHNEHSSANYRKAIGRIFSRFILPRVQAITCNSKHTERSIRTQFSVPEKKLKVIFDPVERRVCEIMKNDARKMLGFSDDHLIIGHVGGMIPSRDQKTLITAFAEFIQHEANSRLILIGDGPVRQDLENLTETLKLEQHVRFVGYTKDVGLYLRCMDIYVNTTLDEGFGIAVVEAMLESLPVVLSDRGAHPELIDHERSGILFQGGSHVKLLEYMLDLAEHPDKRESLGREARKRALNLFSPRRYTMRFESIFDHIISES